MQPLVIEVRRGGTVESRHRVHAAAVRDGQLVAGAGDPRFVTFMRSAAKPLQALPLVRAVDDLAVEEIAIACASHLARPDQLAAVASLLRRAGARTEEDLECGLAGEPPERIRHNCSGKHAGMLMLCRARGWPARGYRLAGHPVQEAMLEQVAAAAEVDASVIPTAVDGCGVVTFALPLERMARAFARLAALEGGAPATAAMRARPELIRGEGSADTDLMRALPGWVAKGGAEGVLCAAGPDGLGVALKCEDGNGRALAPALAAFLAELGHPIEELVVREIRNSRGENVGCMSAKL